VPQIVDYGMGNIRSLTNALIAIGLSVKIAKNPEDLEDAQPIILPGVGHFGTAMENMKANGMDARIIEKAGLGSPVLGICLGMQLLLESSDEACGIPGLGLIPGKAEKISPGNGRKVPHCQWNRADLVSLTACSETAPTEQFYFMHSYSVMPIQRNHIWMTSDYLGHSIVAAIKNDVVSGVQFHPEKSGDSGLNFFNRYFEELKSEHGL